MTGLLLNHVNNICIIISNLSCKFANSFSNLSLLAYIIFWYTFFLKKEAYSFSLLIKVEIQCGVLR